jgi:hypothetical protein
MAMAVESAAALLSRTQHNGTAPRDLKPALRTVSDDKLVIKDEPPEAGPDEPEVDIVINNVVCSFNVRCHLNLRDIALRGHNVEYRKENGVSVQSHDGVALGPMLRF